MKKVFCDIDNTVADQYLRIRKHFNGKNMHKILNNEKLILNDRIINHSREAIKLISKKYEINWLSARPKKLFDVTKAWLKKKKLPNERLYLVDSHEKKIRILKSNDVGLFIDDMKYDYFNNAPKKMTRFIQKLKRLKIKFILFDGNWKKAINIYEKFF